MSNYTTGELAKAAGVTVRTVQYYDTRGILIPSDFSEGGRRLYTEDDLKKLKVICFLRDLGLSLNHVGDILEADNATKVINLLLEEQKKTIETELSERKAQLDRIDEIQKEMKNIANFSVENLGDVAYVMENKKKMNTTTDIFGDELHRYSIADGIRDKNVLGFDPYKVLTFKGRKILPCSIGQAMIYFKHKG